MNPISAITAMVKRLLQRSEFDGEACIRLLLDKTQPIVDRDAAAESLEYYQTPAAADALFSVAADAGEDLSLRETAAEALGAVWSKIGIDRARLERLPEHIRFEVEASMPCSSDTEQARDSERR